MNIRLVLIPIVLTEQVLLLFLCLITNILLSPGLINLSASQKVREINTAEMNKEDAANAGIEKSGEFIKELKLPATLRELGATEEMLPLIADSTVLGGGYKQMTSEDILAVLKNCY